MATSTDLRAAIEEVQSQLPGEPPERRVHRALRGRRAAEALHGVLLAAALAVAEAPGHPAAAHAHRADHAGPAKRDVADRVLLAPGRLLVRVVGRLEMLGDRRLLVDHHRLVDLLVALDLVQVLEDVPGLLLVVLRRLLLGHVAADGHLVDLRDRRGHAEQRGQQEHHRVHHRADHPPGQRPDPPLHPRGPVRLELRLGGQALAGRLARQLALDLLDRRSQVSRRSHLQVLQAWSDG